MSRRIASARLRPLDPAGEADYFQSDLARYRKYD